MVYVKTPATCANMGPAFDCISMAFQIYNEIWIEKSDFMSIISLDGKNVPTDETNLIYSSFLQFFDFAGIKRNFKHLNIKQKSNIPEAKGLGSSAACIVGGVLAANELSGAKLCRDDLLQIASKIEGHADNITSALVGGIVVGIISEDINCAYKSYLKLEPIALTNKGIKFAAVVPEYKTSTNAARKSLPDCYSKTDVIYNISRTAMLVASLATGNIDNLWEATLDRIHQPYRTNEIANYDHIISLLCKNDAIATFLSGSGPSIVVLYNNEKIKNAMDKELAILPGTWRFIEIIPDTSGAIVIA